MDGLPELDGVQRAVVVGEGIAAMVATPDGRDFLLEIASRCRPSIMDLPFRDLVRERTRVDRLVMIVDLVARYGSTGNDARTLGEIMPGLPEDAREQVVTHLLAAGWA